MRTSGIVALTQVGPVEHPDSKSGDGESDEGGLTIATKVFKFSARQICIKKNITKEIHQRELNHVKHSCGAASRRQCSEILSLQTWDHAQCILPESNIGNWQVTCLGNTA